MKRMYKVSGVTLLEVMLVLAVSAMIIVMSLRYYQTTTNNLHVNNLLQMVQGITATADGLAQGSGSYAGGEVTTHNLDVIISMKTPWGGKAKITDVQKNSYEVTFSHVGKSVCIQAKSYLKANSKFDASSNLCTSASDFSYTYNALA